MMHVIVIQTSQKSNKEKYKNIYDEAKRAKKKKNAVLHLALGHCVGNIIAK